MAAPPCTAFIGAAAASWTDFASGPASQALPQVFFSGDGLDSPEAVAQQFCIPSQDNADASSVASDDEPSPPVFPDKEFASFEELRDSVAAFGGLVSSQIGDNSRTASCTSLPTAWLRSMFSNAKGSVRYSGFLYCKCKQQQCDESVVCTWKVPYRLEQNGRWKVCNCNWIHNHDASMLSNLAPSATGLIHLRSVDDLTVEHKAYIISCLDCGISIKSIRFRFRGHFVGYELRARCAKVVKTQYLKEKYGADRHQITKFLEKLQADCNPQAGGVCEITYHENMELGELYFQMPILRSTGMFFGRFSVIDMTHNLTMYDRNQATFNVR